MSNDTDFAIKFSCSSREQLEHVLGYIHFKKARWDYWQNNGNNSGALLARMGMDDDFAAVVSWG